VIQKQRRTHWRQLALYEVRAWEDQGFFLIKIKKNVVVKLQRRSLILSESSSITIGY